MKTKENIVDILKNMPSTKSRLRFCKIKQTSESIIEVEYYGHEVGGSYIHDYEVVPCYISALQYETNRKVEWKGRRSGGIGSDIYNFYIYFNNIISKERDKEIIVGRRYHIDSTCSGSRQSEYAFRTSAGIIWAMMYSISEAHNKNMLGDIVIKVTNNIVSFDGLDLFKIIIPAWEKSDNRPNSGRTHYKGTFDLFITESLFEEKYLKLFSIINGFKESIIVKPRYASHIIIADNKQFKLGYLYQEKY